MKIARTLGCLAFWLLSEPAWADDPLCDCTLSCAQRTDPAQNVSYEDAEHRLWYEVRFWTGACHRDLWWCFEGPSWYEAMDKVLARATPAQRPALCPRLYRMGARMGYEWARDNAIRRIHTADLKAWRSLLLDQNDPALAVSTVEALIDARLSPSQ